MRKGESPPDHVRHAVSLANTGRSWSQESIARREETKRAKRAAGDYPSRKGQRLPPEAVEKTASTNRGRKRTPEQRARQSLGQRLRWASTSQDQCVHGHSYTEETTYVDPKGHRRCRICSDESWRRSRAQRRS